MAYPWTFAGTTIDITAPVLEEHAPVVYSERVIPGGGDTYIDFAANAATHLTLELYFPNPSDYETFKGLRRTTGSLNYVAGTITATLVDVRRSRRNLGSTGETWATAEFIEA